MSSKHPYGSIEDINKMKLALGKCIVSENMATEKK